MIKTCKNTPLISAYADGELSEKDRDRITSHLDACDLCRKEYAAIRSIDRILREDEDLTPSPGFAVGFWRKVDEMEKTKRHGFWFGWRDWGVRPIWAAAAATVMIVFGVLLYRQAPPQSPNEALDAAGLLISEDIELYEDFEIVQHLDLFEQWETISSMEEI